MSAVRSSSIGSFAASLSAFTASIWFRPGETGRLQYIMAAGASASSTPLFAVRLTTADKIEIVGSSTQLIDYALTIGRLHHLLLSHDGTTLYWRLSSIAELANGSAVWASPNLTAADRVAIGSRHDSDADLLSGELYRVYFIRQNLGAATTRGLRARFERMDHDLLLPGYPKMFAPAQPADGTLPDILFGGSQSPADWNAGSNRGTMSFSAASGTTLTEAGIAQYLVAAAMINTPFAGDVAGQYIYSEGSDGTIMRSTPADPENRTAILTYTEFQTFKDSLGVDLGPALVGRIACLASGAMLLLLKQVASGKYFLYRSSNPLDWSTAKNNPVLLTGGNGAGGHKSEVRWLSRQSVFEGTFNGAAAVYLVEYNISNPTNYTDRVWYSTDDGATWTTFWIANQFDGPAVIRHLHAGMQTPAGEIVIFTGDSATEMGLVRGTSTAVWSDIAGQTLAQIKVTRGASYVLDDAATKRIGVLQNVRAPGNWTMAGSEGGDTYNYGTAIWAIKDDFSEVHRVYKAQRHKAVILGGDGVITNGAHIDFDGLYTAFDYMFAWAPGQREGTHMAFQTSRDGWFWAEAGYVDVQGEGRGAYGNAFENFLSGGRWVVGGLYQYILEGRQAALILDKGGIIGNRIVSNRLNKPDGWVTP